MAMMKIIPCLWFLLIRLASKIIAVTKNHGMAIKSQQKFSAPPPCHSSVLAPSVQLLHDTNQLQTPSIASPPFYEPKTWRIGPYDDGITGIEQFSDHPYSTPASFVLPCSPSTHHHLSPESLHQSALTSRAFIRSSSSGQTLNDERQQVLFITDSYGTKEMNNV